ncbi:MAG: hypothetical protein ACRDRK_09285 [Pseudonocardia sp.]
MAASDPTEVVRNLRQHDNGFESVYGLLRVIDGKVDTLEMKVDAGFERLACCVPGRLWQVDAARRVAGGRGPAAAGGVGEPGRGRR